MAEDDCYLLSFHKKHFTKIFFYEFREIGSEIYKNALKRRQRSQQDYKEAINYIEKKRKKKQENNHPFRCQKSFANKNFSSFRSNEIISDEMNESSKLINNSRNSLKIDSSSKNPKSPREYNKNLLEKPTSTFKSIIEESREILKRKKISKLF